jgi:hypothetical protein
MSAYDPPSENIGVFNSSLFTSTSENITQSYADTHYLKYPTAQSATETIPSLVVSNNLTTNNTATLNSLTVSNDATINSLTLGKGTINHTPSYNTALGVSALLNNSTSALFPTFGNNNTAIGYFSLKSNTTGNNNTAVGSNSLTASTGNNTSHNTALGSNAGSDNISGSSNTFVGSSTSNSGGAYTNSTALGYNATITASNQVVLGTTTEMVIIPNQINFNYTSNPTLAVGSIGYTYTSTISSITISNNSQGLLSTISSVPIGVYLVQYLTTYYDVVGTATNTRIKTFAGITSFGNQIASNNVVYFTANDYISATLSVVYTNTAVSNFQLNGALNGSATSIKSYISEGGYFRATRIA